MIITYGDEGAWQEEHGHSGNGDGGSRVPLCEACELGRLVGDARVGAGFELRGEVEEEVDLDVGSVAIVACPAVESGEAGFEEAEGVEGGCLERFDM